MIRCESSAIGAHEKGLLLYPTLLVQNFGPEMATVRCSDFRWENRHLEIGARGDLDPNLPWIDGLDFKHREVQDERFDLIEETLNEYPVDGFELQLNNYPRYFHPDEVEAGIGGHDRLDRASARSSQKEWGGSRVSHPCPSLVRRTLYPSD